ncbi:hypothetical protein FEM03_20805 [Phragmitibacter flavus]|uniref:Uncharacterized protein n=1 Tax=Phragmitibacter flavus TaxID=2576071 RepID=A0A5R8K8X6_9BACT|nr:hypothetical protein [Phragmitibacter flavus]TLD68777.1 hypothetical protein FEM03_20805 [Phragmitibacter flavus]
MNIVTYLIMGLVLTSFGLPMMAQSETRKSEIIGAVGEQADDALFSVHQAVNALADGWVNKTFEEKQALELATSYRGSAELVDGLVKGKSEDVKRTSGLLVKQATALEAWIKIGDEALAETYRKLKEQADAAMAGGAEMGPEMGATVAQGETIELKIVKSVAPGGKEGDLGTMTVTRKSKELPLEVKWAYADGGSDQGLCVPFPNSGEMAVFYGEGVKSVHIFKIDGKNITGCWASVEGNPKIRSIRLTQADNVNDYDIVGVEGGKFSVMAFKGGMASVTWKFKGGLEVSGIGVWKGDYLAAIDVEPKAKAGVLLYSMAPDGKTATCRWIMNDVSGVGEETLEVTAMSPNFLTGGGSPTVTATAGNVRDEVRQIAEQLRENLGNAVQYRPSTSQINAISATLNDAELLRAYVEEVYTQIPSTGPAAKPGQNEILVEGPDLKDLPGGYTQKIKHFRPGTDIYRFKYVAPGQDIGMSYDGLIKVKDQWIFIPKAWRAFK